MSGVESKQSEEEALDPFSALYDLGLIIFQDDAHDLAKGPFHSTEEIAKGEAPIHHWFVGALVMLGSVLGKLYYAFESAKLAEQHLTSTT